MLYDMLPVELKARLENIVKAIFAPRSINDKKQA